ncbi:hypothetical protein HGM15179_017058 [Zosterops borbonicus]|uniref:Glycerol kinase n=1 Tax=Zosterops borbonicus TaxID=364589 RepID=A0A8K1G1M3_9PASS|nr:hypothetical protein HGM15179_017058 [Zosterops borbonicus]
MGISRNLEQQAGMAEFFWILHLFGTGAGDIIVGACYRLPDQEDPTDKTLYRQVEVASSSQALVLMRGSDFYHPSICWKDNTTAGYKQSKSLQEYVDDNFLLQVIEEPTRRDAMLDLVLANKKGLVGNVKLKGSLGCSDHEMVEFENLRAVARRVHNKLTALDFRRADFGLFGDMLDRVSWDKALEGRSKRTG